MKVILSDSAEILLRNLSEGDRQRIQTWIDHLRRWDTDPSIRQQAKKLEASVNTYMLFTNTDLRIFFALQDDTITILDLAKKATIVSSGQIFGAEGR